VHATNVERLHELYFHRTCDFHVTLPNASASPLFSSNSAFIYRSTMSIEHWPKAYISNSVDMASGDMMSLGIRSRHASPSRVGSLSGKRSLGARSTADGCFEQYNTEVQIHNNGCMNDDSPFFIDNSSPIEAPSTNLLQLDADYVTVETFRTIVDDLTVQIGSLKRQLGKDEKPPSLVSESRKPFEIKVHSLKSDEKCELERILHRFVSDLPTRSVSEDTASRYGDVLPTAELFASMSPQISTLGACSAQVPGSASVRRLSPSVVDSERRGFPDFGSAKRVHVKPDNANHTSDCVVSLENLELMTTKEVVVHRLEQLFAGKDVFTAPGLEALQQSEILQEVAHVENAMIQVWEQQAISESVCAVRKIDTLVTSTTTKQLDITQQSHTINLVNPKLGKKMTDMLPRPELGPSQLVAENVRYIRQIGLSPVDAGNVKLSGDKYEWFYLNALANMAELHTLNVTRDFIQKAVSELSGHFTVSNDGQKVRWNSSWNVVRKRRHNEADGEDLSTDTYDETSISKDKRLKTTHNISSRASLRTGIRLKHAPATWISHRSNGKLVFAPRLHISSNEITNSTSSSKARHPGRALVDASEVSGTSDREPTAHDRPLLSDR
jgi:hypothetical protein